MKKSAASCVLPKRLQHDIDRVIEPHLKKRASGDGIVSRKTAHDRRIQIRASIAQLWMLGFKIQKLDSLSVKHIKALMACWCEHGVSAGYLHNRLSTLRTLAGWLGKRNLVGDLDDYCPPERFHRHSATKENLAWYAKGVDPVRMINFARKVDERFAVMLSLQYFFGLRVKESIELRPSNALVNNGTSVEIHNGTKGGRFRLVPLETDEQKEAFEWACRVAATGSSKRVRWPELTWRRARRRFYYLLSTRLLATKDQLGGTPHGLRHAYAQEKYERESGFAVPLFFMVDGKAVPPDGLTAEAHRQAAMSASRALGHGRLDVTPAYYGTYGHSLRSKKQAVSE